MSDRTTWPIGKIIVGMRFRKDLGDIRALADSIEEVGLLHPIVVAPDGKLIAGHRRLEALRLLGKTEVPVSVVPIDQIIRGEQHENTKRKDFLPSESVAIFEALKEKEAEAASERIRAAQETSPKRIGPGKFPEPIATPAMFQQPVSTPVPRPVAPLPAPAKPATPTGQSRDLAAVGTGRSGRTVEKAAAVVHAARQDPERFGHLVEQMDRTGKVDGAFKVVKEARRREEMRQALPETKAAADSSDLVTIEHGDVFDVLARVADGSVQMICTDWPYNIGQHAGGTKVGPDYVTFDPGEWDRRDQDEWLDWCHAVIEEFRRVLRPNGSLLVFTDRALISYLWDGLKEEGMRPKNTITWLKTNAAPNARGNLDSATEMAVWAVKGSGYTFHRPPSGQCPNVWSGPFVSGPTRTNYPHPTAKPVAMLQHFIELFTDAGNLVLDPFGGSGSTLEACIRSGRRCHTSDADPDYVATMATRFRDVAGELGLLEQPSVLVTLSDVFEAELDQYDGEDEEQPDQPPVPCVDVPTRKARLPKMRWWFVHAHKHPQMASSTVMEHTYREKARTAEDARNRIASLPLVVEVLDVRPVEEGQ